MDRDDATVDLLLTAKRDLSAARRFLEHAIGQHGLPDTITIDKSSVNTAAVRAIQDETGAPIGLRQVKYLNSIVEQDHRSVKMRIAPMLGSKLFKCAGTTIAGIGLM